MKININAMTVGLACAVLTSSLWSAERPTGDIQVLANSVVKTHDSGRQPFAIIDKVQARLFVFQPDGRVQGSTPVLLGSAKGDDSVPGIGQRKIADIRLAERTTPAGRFVSQPGRNLQGEDLIWFKHSEGLAIHRLRPGGKLEQRAQRLASSTSQDNRISLGCVVVPVAFYHSVVAPVIGKSLSVVYVLPETLPVQALFGALD